jgi:hypothetical protein
MNPSCIVNSLIGTNSSSDTATDTANYVSIISDIYLFFTYPPYYGYNVSFTQQSFEGYAHLMTCITDTTTGTPYYWPLVVNQSLDPIYNYLNVNPTLAYILNRSGDLIQVDTTNEPTFVTSETYSDIIYYVLIGGIYTFTLHTTSSSTIGKQLTTTYTVDVLDIDTSGTTPTQTITLT